MAPKHSGFVSRFIWHALKGEGLVLDCFGGTGSTGHAAIDVTRMDGKRRRFVVVELDRHFDVLVLPRITKVMFSPEWKDGKPKRMATKEEAERTPRLVKVLRLESYEDALHNVAAPATLERVKAREQAYKEVVGDEAYRLRYLVSLPLEASDSMLNVEKLEHPFDYTLEVLTEDGPKQKAVDVLETFNFLYGLRVQRMETWQNEADRVSISGRAAVPREYRVVKATDREQKRRILVVWRDITDLDPKTDREFLQAKVAELAGRGEAYDERLVNSDCASPSFASLDPMFKRLMCAGESE